MSVENDEDSSSAEVPGGDLLDRPLVIDLADPPSRSDLGLPDDRGRVVLERDDREPFEVTVRFRDGRELTTPARQLGVATDGPGEPPYELVIRRDGMTLDDLQAALDTAVTDLGADRGRVESLLRAATTTTEGDSDLIRSIPTAVEPPDRLTVQPVVTAREGRVSVNYVVRWEAS